jgi:hypothetical protein
MKNTTTRGQNKRQQLLLWLIFQVCWLPIFAQQGSTCSEPIVISSGNALTGVSISGAQTWFSFQANSASSVFKIIAETSGSEMIDSFTIYQGNCIELTQLGTSNQNLGGHELILTDLIIGQTYYIRLYTHPPFNSSVTVSDDDWNWSIPCACIVPPSSCERVCNGSFEQYNASPWQISQLNLACPWYSPSSSPDLYGTGGAPDVSVPNNIAGSETPHSGNSYAGFYAYGPGNLREYIHQQLSIPLQTGYKYRVSFWVSLANESRYGCNNLGIYFANGAISQSNNNPINVTPAFATTQVITNMFTWVNIVDTITAMSNFTHFCIGNFQNNNNTATGNANVNPASQFTSHAYYYIDDISIMLIPDSITAQTLPGVCAGNPTALQANYPNSPPQSYQWFPQGQVFPGNSQYNFIYPQLPSPQTYWVVADWGNGCTSTDTTSINVYPNVTVNAGADVTICQGQSHTLSASVSGGNSYSWSILNGNVLCTGCTTLSITPSVTTSYVISGINSFGCNDKDTITVSVLPAPLVNAGADITVCLGQPVSLNATVSGTYNQFGWVTNLSSVCNGCISVGITATQGLQYAIFTATNTLTGCTDTDTLFITLTQLQGVSLIPTLGYASNILCANVQYSVYGAPAGSQYIWSQTSTPVAVTGAVSGVGQYTANWSTAALTSASINCTVVAPDGCSAILSIPVVDSCCFPAPLDRSIVLNNSNSSTFLGSILAQCPTCTVSGNTVISPSPLAIAVHINGSFTIDQNLVLVNFGNIRMGTNAAVYIPGGKAFEMRTCTTTTYCGMMWDGIYAIGSTAAFKATQNTVLQQAKNAVVSSGGGVFTVENTTIRNCLKGIVVTPYSAAAHLGRVRSTTFEMPGTFLPASPALPTSYNKTLIGIEINRVSNITIGDATLATYQNTFNGIYKGIYAIASNTTVRNSRFINLPVSGSNPIPITGTAIHCEGQKNIPWQQAVNVGGTAANQRCTFDNLRKGIVVNLAHNVTFVNNQITNLTDNLFSWGMGVSVQNCLGRNINVSNNRISNQNSVTGFTYGIIATDVSGSTVNITNNRILQSANISNNYQQQKGIGIFVQNAIAAPVALNIFNNDTIRRFMYGVAVTNISNTSLGFVNQNRILIDKPKTAYTQLHCGISIMNCTMIKADTNRVIRTSSPNWNASDAPSVATNLRGVFITNSQGCVVSDNTFGGMGEGVHANGNCANTFFVCNVFQNSYRGFMGTGAVANSVLLPDQLFYLNAAYPTGNSFTGSVTADLTGSIRSQQPPNNTPINWYFSGSQPLSTLAIGSLTNGNQPISLINIPTQCSNPIFIAPTESLQREILAGSQMEIAESTVADEMTKEMSAKDAHRLLVEHPDWLYLNTAQDGDYQQFFTETDTTELAQANYAEIAALADNEQQAILQNGALGGSTDLTGNHKAVFEIYNRTWLRDSVALTAADSATLLAIALLHPAQGGDAVYTARVMLRLMVDDATGNYYNYRVASNTETALPVVEVFPNPANTQITITGHYLETDVIEFALYDLTGRLLTTAQLQTGNGTITVDLTQVLPGAYIYSIRVNGSISSSKQLIIAR